MSKPRKSKHNNLKEMDLEIESIYSILTKLEGAGNVSTTTIIYGGSSGGSSSSSSVANLKSGTETVTANTAKTVTFPSTFSTSPSVVLCFLSGSDGSFVPINTKNISTTTSTFTIPAADIIISGDISYIATIN